MKLPRIFLQRNDQNFDLVYIDPARRDISGRKVFRFRDCSPDITRLLPSILKITDQVLIKASPMMDISLAINELGSIERIHILADSRECKEVLYLIGKGKVQFPPIHCHQLNSGKEFRFSKKIEEESGLDFRSESGFLYLPGPSLSKGGAFKALAIAFGLHAMNANTNILCSTSKNSEFPGRIFEIIELTDVKGLKQMKDKNFNVISRNFPIEQKTFIKKYGINEVGDLYLICYKGFDEQLVLAICRRH